MQRISKENYYLNIAQTVLERATCLRRVYGAIIVKNDEIISTGYNGAPRGRRNCVDMGYCTRERLQVPRGERYELCRSVHAEANAIISASRRDMVGGTLYLVGRNAQTGELLTRRSAVWRFYDFFWRLHILDFKNGENFNHPLLIGLTLLTLSIVVTGFILLWIRLARDLKTARAVRAAQRKSAA